MWKLYGHKQLPRTSWHRHTVRGGHTRSRTMLSTTVPASACSITCTQSVLPETASHDHRRWSTRRSHTAGRASTGWPLFHAHSISSSPPPKVYYKHPRPSPSYKPTSSARAHRRRAARERGRRALWWSSYMTRDVLPRLEQLERAVAHATDCHRCDTTTRKVSVCQGRREAEGTVGRMCELYECAAESSSPFRRFERSDPLRHCSAGLMPISAQTARRRWLFGSLRGAKASLTHQCPPD